MRAGIRALYRVINQRAVKTTVKIAEISGNSALVESGVSEGDEVILFPGEKIKQGIKVR